MKSPSPAKTEQAPKALDTLIGIVDLAIPYRFQEQVPTLSAIVRLVSTASRVVGIRDLDERISVENAAVITLAKKRGLVS